VRKRIWITFHGGKLPVIFVTTFSHNHRIVNKKKRHKI